MKTPAKPAPGSTSRKKQRELAKKFTQSREKHHKAIFDAGRIGAKASKKVAAARSKVHKALAKKLLPELGVNLEELEEQHRKGTELIQIAAERGHAKMAKALSSRVAAKRKAAKEAKKKAKEMGRPLFMMASPISVPAGQRISGTVCMLHAFNTAEVGPLGNTQVHTSNFDTSAFGRNALDHRVRVQGGDVRGEALFFFGFDPPSTGLCKIGGEMDATGVLSVSTEDFCLYFSTGARVKVFADLEIAVSSGGFEFFQGFNLVSQDAFFGPGVTFSSEIDRSVIPDLGAFPMWSGQFFSVIVIYRYVIECDDKATVDLDFSTGNLEIDVPLLWANYFA